jgi:very-short-patch-repair endonuclease
MTSKSSIELARNFRKQPTRAEQTLWRVLRNRQLDGHKFYRQKPIGLYVVDFCCWSRRLIIEVDGGVHVGREVQDQEREKALEKLGYRVIRFTNDQVEKDMNQVVEAVRAALGIDPHPWPSP